jgi:hypothetical protein
VSVRTPNGPLQRTICSLGDLGPGSRETWVKRARKLEHAIAGQQDLLERRSSPEFDAVLEKAKAHRQRHASQPPAEETVTVNPNQITSERHREAGPVHVGHRMAATPDPEVKHLYERLHISAKVMQPTCHSSDNVVEKIRLSY